MRDLKIDEIGQVYGAGSRGRKGGGCGNGHSKSKKSKSKKSKCKKSKSKKSKKRSYC